MLKIWETQKYFDEAVLKVTLKFNPLCVFGGEPCSGLFLQQIRDIVTQSTEELVKKMVYLSPSVRIIIFLCSKTKWNLPISQQNKVSIFSDP